MAVSMDQITQELIEKGHHDLAAQLQSGLHMDRQLYDAARSGDTRFLRHIARSCPNRLHGETQLRETAIHVALRYGQIDFAEQFYEQCPAMLLRPNTRGITPLHWALKARQYSFFVEGVKQLLSQDYLQDLWDTDLGGMILDCISANMSLLYVAADMASLEAVKSLLQSPLGRNANGPKGGNALHAAILRSEYGIAFELLKHQSQLSEESDDSGNAPLHYAVCFNDKQMVELLLPKCASIAYVRNREELSPIHLAAIMDLDNIFHLLQEQCPDSGLMTGRRGSNALHLSVEVGAQKIVDSILSSLELEELINEPDTDGNTPLHLATINRSFAMVKTLCKDNRVDKHARNNDGLTARDIDAKYKSSLITRELSIPGASVRPSINEIASKCQSQIQHCINEAKVKTEKVARGKGLANSLLVVATLITTVTFTAAFTMPGGYKSDDPNQGISTLAKKAAFKVFLIFDTLSMSSSIIAAFHLIWAGWYNDPYSQADIIKKSICMMVLAIACMGVAFATGVYVVIASQCLWVAVVIIVITCIAPFLMAGFGIRTLYKDAKRQKVPDVGAIYMDAFIIFRPGRPKKDQSDLV